MTTYELPPEPPIGESVRDAYGRTWKHIGVNNWTANPDSVLIADSRPWLTLLASSPLTLIEPDPWPTTPLIAWTVNGDRGLFVRNIFGNYVALTNGQVVSPHDHDETANPVPVKPVPVAELDALREALRVWDKEGFAPLIPSARNLIAATDALGLDQ